MIQHLIKVLPLLFFLLVSTSKAQELSLYTGLYHINTNAYDYLEDQEKTKNQYTDVTFNIGSFLDFKHFTLYSEFVLDYNNERNESEYLIPFKVLQIHKAPAFTTLNTRLGIGKRIIATKQIQIRFISYLGYSYIGKQKHKRVIDSHQESNQTLTITNGETPGKQKVELGVKTLVEYQCFKNVYFGVGLDFNLQFIHQNGSSKSEMYIYGAFQNLIKFEENSTHINHTSFDTQFFEVSMYLSYRIWKK